MKRTRRKHSAKAMSVIASDPVKMPHGADAWVRILDNPNARSDHRLTAQLMFSDGKSWPIPIGVPLPRSVDAALANAHRFLKQVYGRSLKGA